MDREQYVLVPNHYGVRYRELFSDRKRTPVESIVPPVPGAIANYYDYDGKAHWRVHGMSIIAGSSSVYGDGVEFYEVWYPGDEGPTGWQTREDIARWIEANAAPTHHA